MADWLYRLFGATPPSMPAPVYTPPPDLSWPDSTKEDMSLRAYGTPAAAFVAPAEPSPARGGREGRAPVGPEYSGRVRTIAYPEEMKFAFNEERLNPRDFIPPQPMDAATQKDMADAYLASQKTALAALGFDPRRMMVGTGMAARKAWTAGGQFDRATDNVVVTGSHPNSYVHESLHRGVDQLVKAGKMQPLDNEEILVRAMMQRGLGMIERGRSDDRQVTRGQMYRESETGRKKMDEVEALAAQLIAERTPRGPR